jgi:uncharacterized membrane protein
MRWLGWGLLLAGCTGTGTGACPNDLPASCPSPAPTYAADVAPIVAARCFPCHAPGGAQSTTLLDTQAHLHSRRSAVLNQVYACTMPRPDAGALTAAERQTLLAYLVCGAN